MGQSVLGHGQGIQSVLELGPDCTGKSPGGPVCTGRKPRDSVCTGMGLSLYLEVASEYRFCSEWTELRKFIIL